MLIIGAVLLVPSVGEAVSGWFGRLFDRNKYLGTLPGEPGEYAGCGGGDTDSEG